MISNVEMVYRLRNGAACIAVTAVLVCGSPVRAEAEDESLCIPPGMETRTTALIADPGFGVAIPDDDGVISFESISIDKTIATFTLARSATSQGENPVALARVLLRPVAAAEESDRRSRNFAVGTKILRDTPGVRKAVERAVESILAHDSDDYYQTCEGPPGSHDDSSAAAERPLGLWSAVLAVMLLLGAAVANFMRGKRDGKQPDETGSSTQ